jgi:hypothetical protein
MARQIPNTFAQIWTEFRRNCLDGHVNAATQKTMKDVFYAGAQSYINLMRKAFEQGKTGTDFRNLHLMVEDEIRAYFEQFMVDTVH